MFFLQILDCAAHPKVPFIHTFEQRSIKILVIRVINQVFVQKR